jgi:hypothetical protein
MDDCLRFLHVPKCLQLYSLDIPMAVNPRCNTGAAPMRGKSLYKALIPA